MRYPVVLHKDPETAYGVTVPDLPGCFSAGDTVDEALLNAIEAIECHLESLLIDGEEIPTSRNVEDYFHNRDFAGGTWALVEIDLSKLSGKVRSVNVTIPEQILNRIDSFASSSGESRSGLLIAAALEYLTTHSQRSV
jgi:predicted RNase H-like HicB family nuclease